jgi:type II secretion system protein G
MRKNQKGFTIIELLVVIVIIGILVALALPNLFAAQARGRDSDRKNELKNLQQRLESYFNDNGAYPTGALTAATTATPPGIGASQDEAEGPRGDDYTYTAEAGGTGYTLDADLENDDDPDAIDNNGTYRLNSVN